MDNGTFVTMINCSLGGIAPMLRGKIGKPIVVPKRTGENVGDMRPDQARKLDAGLFRGTALAPMETALGGLGVEAIVVGGRARMGQARADRDGATRERGGA